MVYGAGHIPSTWGFYPHGHSFDDEALSVSLRTRVNRKKLASKEAARARKSFERKRIRALRDFGVLYWTLATSSCIILYRINFCLQRCSLFLPVSNNAYSSGFAKHNSVIQWYILCSSYFKFDFFLAWKVMLKFLTLLMLMSSTM